MIDFSAYKGWAIPNGVVTQIADASGRVIWKLETSKPVVLQVEKITSDTYAGETTYTGEQFVLLDIYPQNANSTVKVTYGGSTKTLAFNGTNAKQVYFGTFNGVSDSVSTPASGTLVIEGGYKSFAIGTYKTYNSTTSKQTTKYASCITAVDDWGSTEYVPSYAFYECVSLALIPLPSGITSIGTYAFYNCQNITLSSLPSGITSIGNYAFFGCTNLALTSLPSGITSIGTYAFCKCEGLQLFSHGKYNAFPDSLTTIGAYAFLMNNGERYKNGDPWYTGGQGNLILPYGLTSIGDYAFTSEDDRGTNAYLTNVTMLATTPPTIGEYPFSGINIDSNKNILSTTFTVPVGCADAYKTAWEIYAKCITEVS